MPFIEGTKVQSDAYGNPMIGGGSQTLSQGTSTNSQQTSNNSTPSQSGSWTNLNQYIDANKGQNNTAQAISNKTSGLADSALGQFNTANQKANDAINNYSNVASTQKSIKDMITSPIGQDKNNYDKLVGSLYNPGNNYSQNNYIQDINSASQSAKDASNTLSNYQTPGARQQEYAKINESVSPGGYSQGSKSLDDFLFMNTEQGQKVNQDIQNQNQSLQNYVPTDLSSGIETAQKGLDESLLNSNDVKNYAGGILQNQYKALPYNEDNYVDKNSTDYTNNIAKIRALESLSDNPEMTFADRPIIANTQNINPSIGQNITGVNTNKFNASVSGSNALTQSDIDKINEKKASDAKKQSDLFAQSQYANQAAAIAAAAMLAGKV